MRFLYSHFLNIHGQLSSEVKDQYILTEHIGLDKQNFQRKNVNIFLPISLNICFWCSKEPSH